MSCFTGRARGKIKGQVQAGDLTTFKGLMEICGVKRSKSICGQKS